MTKEEKVQVVLGTAFVCENCQQTLLSKDQYLFSLSKDFDLISQICVHGELIKVDSKYCKKCIKKLRLWFSISK